MGHLPRRLSRARPSRHQGLRAERRPTARLILVAIVGVLATACAPGMIFGPDFVLFTPKAAPIVDRADCLTPDIYTGLTGLGPWPSADIAPAPELGYPPDDFDPVSVVRCELAQNPAGNTTVDAVSLAGDVAAVVEAFSIESRRYPDNVSISCAISVDPAVGLWLVDARGRAIRPAWPSVPCSFREEPLDALRALHEVGRESFDTGVPITLPRNCTERFSGSMGGVYSGTAAIERERRALNLSARPLLADLALPIDDVGPLQACRHGVNEPAQGGGWYLWLTARESSNAIRSVLGAPIAAPCSLTATRLVSIRLSRADGSGGVTMSVELDGCRRVGQNAAPEALIEMLSR